MRRARRGFGLVWALAVLVATSRAHADEPANLAKAGTEQAVEAEDPEEALEAEAQGWHWPGNVVTHDFDSAALGRLSKYKLYLPPEVPGFVGPPPRLPVIVALHGLGGSGRDWFSFRGGQLAGELDAAIREGRLPPVAVVAPNGQNGYWTNHLGGKRGTAFGDLIAETLAVATDRHGLDRRRVVIAGVSMGGHGAMSDALRNPSRYKGVVTLGGALFDVPPTHRPVYFSVWGRPADPNHWAATAPAALYAMPGLAARAPPVWLHYGEHDDDRFVRWNRHAIAQLTRHAFQLETAVDDGSHGWRTWRQHTRTWLAWAAPLLR